ncbi:hypothetical protein GO604_02245 [Aeromonas hydrophila subsp. ranae]|uniref:Uncharacterized protein n=1 Tax=Aeromonas hydrophila subsp. hydrophila (strain ATCC 7966 / DSM 30187 / BCRC 13018 / CCUG 14551 / JCM 1027 / KCTC 2358 / NCIMB 9240 / NCTC 8049) TaxID=380703 RepID=A0KKG0_AERHH|nr:hypothetical protein AHA_2237 [Aeromonas hydrophila subsp. hydrophila ATCC 7966]MBM0436125.1 hypothetical protein [Aeromonas hydrophila subsp. ranae]QGZ73039.1 hypothetical protein GQR50_11160 [Aeromonas hydrophila]
MAGKITPSPCPLRHINLPKQMEKGAIGALF